MCYSTQPRVSVKDYGYLFFAQNMGKNIDKNVLILAKAWVVITAKNILIMPNNALQRLSKLYQRGQFKKKAEATGDLTGNKTAEKITKIWITSQDKKNQKQLRMHIIKKYLSKAYISRRKTENYWWSEKNIIV